MTLEQAKHALKVRMGYEITTSTGHTWTAVPTGWKDSTSKLTWKYEGEPGKYTFDEATSRFGESLPTKEEWEEAEKHGIREVLELEGRPLRSSSLVSDFRNVAWVFYTDDGGVDFNNRVNTNSVRLIGR